MIKSRRRSRISRAQPRAAFRAQRDAILSWNIDIALLTEKLICLKRELASLDDFDVNPVAAIAMHHALQWHWKSEDLRSINFSALDGQQLLDTSLSNFSKKESGTKACPQ